MGLTHSQYLVMLALWERGPLPRESERRRAATARRAARYQARDDG